MATDKQLESNNIIAAFDDKIKDDDFPWWRGYDVVIHGGTNHHEEQLKYDTSWNWQIPVWSKFVNIWKHTLSNYGQLKKYQLLHHRYTHAIENNVPLGGFNVLVEAIEWYKNNFDL